MVKEGIIVLAEDIENLTQKTLEICKCPLEDCFPVSANKLIEIDGNMYELAIDVKIKKIDEYTNKSR